MEKYTLPTLYKKAKKGKISEWSIWIELDENNIPVIIRKSGFIGFKHRETKRYIRKGTNIGKKNEKSAWDNAIFITNNYWKDHIEDNWVDNIDKINDEPLYLKPMLAQPFKRNIDFKNKIVQPKYNGIRALSFLHKSDNRILSRERKQIDTMDHIRKQIDELFLGKYSPDGELYHHDLTFQEIVRRVKKYRPELSEEIQYWVYDLAVPDIPFEERLYIIDNLVNDNDIIRKSVHHRINSYDEFIHYHNQYVKDGYEGIILRDPDSMYIFNDRPSCLIKYKEFKDDEFEVVDYTVEEWDDNGIMKNLVVWVCETEYGEKFNVRPKGSFERRINWLINVEKYIGKMLTVRYQEESENGTPIFGVGIEFRDYE